MPNLDSVLKAAEQRPIGFFQLYDSEDLMDMNALKSFEQVVKDAFNLGNEAKSVFQNYECKHSDLTHENLPAELSGAERHAKSIERSLALFQSDTDDFSVETSPEIEEMKLNVFGEIIEDLLQESLSEFLEGEKQITDSSLKKYYRSIFGPTDKKKKMSELNVLASPEYMSFRKLFKRFVG